MILANRLVLFFGTLVLLFATLVESESGVVRIRPSGGLNTIADDFTIPPEDARIAHNIDFSANIGGITVRRGYDSVGYRAGQDSLIGIYPAYYSDGTEQLIFYTDSLDVGYGNVYATTKGTITLSSATRIYTKASVFNKPSFATFQDNLYMVNGSPTGFVYRNVNNTAYVQPFPLPAPGAVVTTPMRGGGGLNGTYRYAFSYTKKPVDSPQWFSTLSPPVNVPAGGSVLLSRFMIPQRDSLSVANSDNDDAVITIWRTKGNVGILDNTDSIFQIGNAYFTIDSSNYTTITYTDTMSDAYIDDIASSFAIGYKIVNPHLFGYEVANGRNHAQTRLYGSPSLLAHDSVASPPSGDSGIWEHTPQVADTTALSGVKGFAWAVAWVDTITGIQSDTGRSFCLSFPLRPPLNRFEKVQLVMPRAPSGGLTALLFRSPITAVTTDTGWVNLQNGSYWGIYVDSVTTGTYYLVGKYAPGSTVYDSLNYDTLRTRTIYRNSSAPSSVNRVFTYGGALYVTTGSRIYRSRLDTGTAFGALSFQSVNGYDGDVITDAWPTRTAIRVMKNKSSFNVYDDMTKTEISSYIGDVAERSHVAGGGGHYYLSDVGVIRESDGDQLERTFNQSLISQKLKNFDNMSLTTKSTGVGLYNPISKQYYLCIGDTTYVFDERTNTWATWDIRFAGGALYGAGMSNSFVPGDTLYFIWPGRSNLYRYGVSGTCNFTYQSAPFGLESNSGKSVSAVGVWGSGFVSPFGTGVFLKDELGNACAPAINIGTSINGYTKRSLPPDTNSLSMYHSLVVYGVGAQNSGWYRAFDIYQHDIGEVEER